METDRDTIPAGISAAARAFIKENVPLARKELTAGFMANLRRENRESVAAQNQALAADLCDEVADLGLGGVPVQVVTPKGYDPRNDGRALLYFFGGGFIVGSPLEDLSITARLAERFGVRVFVPHYRLAPEHPFPAAREDGLAVYRALLEGEGGRCLAMAGESAGGNLALTVTLEARRQGLVAPKALALLSPWCDLSKTGDSHWRPGADPTLDYDLTLVAPARAYAGGRELQDPEISPLYDAYDADFPPCLVTSATRDLFMSDCARLTTKLRQAGVAARLHLWEGLWHVFEWYPEVPEAAQSLDEIAAFLAEHIDPV